MAAFFSANVDPRWMWALTVLTIVSLIAMYVVLSQPESRRDVTEPARLRIEFPDPIREIGYIAAGGVVTPSWALDVLLIAEGQPLDVTDLFISQEGIGRWTTQEITAPSGKRLYTPLRVARSLRLQIRATSPQSDSVMPATLGGLLLVAQDHRGRSYVVRFSEWSRGARLSATQVVEDHREPGRFGRLLRRRTTWFALPAAAVGMAALLGYTQSAPESKATGDPVRATRQAARLIPVVHRVHFAKRAEGEYLAVVDATLRNTGRGAAERVLLRHQHRPGQWTGVVQWRDRLEIPPGGELGIRFSADTFADPRGPLLRGERTYFALRIDWDNADGGPGCARFFVEYVGAPGADVGEIVVVPTVREDVPPAVKEGLSLPECGR